ncbi:hypothetical protein ACFL5G_02665 [Candidatus Margulisiibacteriota bacterium]
MKRVLLVLLIVVVAVTMVWAMSNKPVTTTKATAYGTAEEYVICPVNSTRIKKEQAFDTVVYEKQTYYMCCPDCKQEFLKYPEKYIKK